MKNPELTAFIKVFLILICFVGLKCSPVQSQKISIERVQLVELTKKAEKAALYEDENTKLIVENYTLKQANKTLSGDLATAKTNADTYRKQRNQNRYALAALLAAVLVSIGLRVRKLFL